MFFLTVYGTVNIVATFEVLSGDPSWRPKIKVPWPITLVGGFACVVVMVLISPIAGLIALVAEFSLWLYLSRRAQKARCGDARRGLYEALIRWALIRLNERPMSARNWRPHLLTFVDDPLKELDLIRFGDWFSQGRGVVTVCNLVVGDLMSDDLDIDGRRSRIQSVIDAEDIVVFPEVDAVNDIVEGMVNVSQANGMAGMSSNTVLLGWPDSVALRAEFLRVMRRLERLNKSFVLARIRPKYMFRRESPIIHVWWGGLERNGDLMLLLAHLLHSNAEWSGARVSVMSLASSELMRSRTEDHLKKLLPEIRIDAEVRVVLKPKDETVTEVIHRESAEAAAVFLGLEVPETGDEEAYAERMDRLAGDLPVVFFVKNSSLFVGDLLETTEPAVEADGEEGERTTTVPPATPVRYRSNALQGCRIQAAESLLSKKTSWRARVQIQAPPDLGGSEGGPRPTLLRTQVSSGLVGWALAHLQSRVPHLYFPAGFDRLGQNPHWVQIQTLSVSVVQSSAS